MTSYGKDNVKSMPISRDFGGRTLKGHTIVLTIGKGTGLQEVYEVPLKGGSGLLIFHRSRNDLESRRWGQCGLTSRPAVV